MRRILTQEMALPTLLLVATAVGCQKNEEVGGARAVLTPAHSVVVAPEAVLGADAGLKEPRGIGVDAKGQIFVGDTGNSRVVRLGATGSILPWGGQKQESATGTFGLLADVAVTPDGKVVTLDALLNDVRVFTRDGKLILRLPAVSASASGIAVGADGRIWVADTRNGRVLRFTPDGKPDGIFLGETGGAYLRFEQPTDVALAPDGTAYVVDLRSRIMRLAEDGKITKEWKVEWSGAPRGGCHLAVWQGLVVMTDPERGRLHVLDPATGTVRFIGEVGTAPGQFRLPVGIAAGSDGKLYVVDSENSRVQVFTSLGK